MSHRKTFLLSVPLLLSGFASAQLDLPCSPQPSPKDPASELVPRNPPSGDVAPRPGGEPLELPRPLQPASAGEPPAVANVPEELALGALREVARKRFIRDAQPSLDRLLALGPAVLPFLQAELGSQHGPTLWVSARVLMANGGSADRSAVASRLMRALPAETAVPLLSELVDLDPMLTSPEYLCGLLDHPTSAMRTAAFNLLEGRLERVPLSALVPVFSSPRTASRSAALELVALSRDPLALNLMVSRLGDSSAQVARRAADLLALNDDAQGLLLERAFPGEAGPGPLAWDRARAYALLAVVEREEVRSLALLEGTDPAARIESMRAGLDSSQPLVAGACAIGLARIGYRSSASRTGSWIDRDVPHRLVSCITGAEFHSDFSALERPSARALTLLSGQAFGSDADAWRHWWLANVDLFSARHAVIELPEDASRQMLAGFLDGEGRSVCFVGPERKAPTGVARVLRLDSTSAERVRVLLEDEGVFGASRPAGGVPGSPAALWVAVGDQEKRFDSPRGSKPSWLDGVRGELEALVEENLWQLYFDPVETTALAWWQDEHERWAGLGPLERQRALAELLLARARRASDSQRDLFVAELKRLYADAAVPSSDDFEPLLGLLASETFFGPRAEALCELARVAAGAPGKVSLDTAPRERLLGLVLEHFGPEADEALKRVARSLDTEALELLGKSSLARARALAAEGLSRSPGGEVWVRTLLADPDPEVQLSVLRALAAHPNATESVQSLHEELFDLARNAAPELRVAALRVLALWGGEGVHGLALETVGDPNPTLQMAAISALAELADPRSASLLASMLARGPDSPFFAEARRGLKRMGVAGTEECLRLAHSVSARARRESTLLLSESLAPQAAPLLLTLLSEDPGDQQVIWELSVLSGLDLTREERPDGAGWSWWDLVVHDDPLAWLLAAAERESVPAPNRETLVVPEDGSHTLDPAGANFLLAIAALPAPHLLERATRELEMRLGIEFRRFSSAQDRVHFLDELREAVRARTGE